MSEQSRLSASLEDYLEAIYHIMEEKGEVRSKDIQERLSVSGASVTEACQLLGERGLVNYAKYEAVKLTTNGKHHAQDIIFRHETLRDFFMEVLKVDTETADEGACRMEHVVSPKIVDRMIKYTKYLRQKGETKKNSEEPSFAEFLESRE